MPGDVVVEIGSGENNPTLCAKLPKCDPVWIGQPMLCKSLGVGDYLAKRVVVDADVIGCLPQRE
jgi:hypothetical protein